MGRDPREMLGEGRGKRRVGIPEGAVAKDLGPDLVRDRYDGSPFRGLAVPPAPPDLIRLIGQLTGISLRPDQWEELERLRAFFGIAGVGNDPKLATWRAGEPVRRAAPVVVEVEAARGREPRIPAGLPDYDPTDLGE